MPEPTYSRADLDPHFLPAFDEAAAAVAAGKSVLLIGPPGGGKSPIARRLREHVKVDPKRLADTVTYHRMACMDPEKSDLVSTVSNPVARAPFRSPHHTCSPEGLCGSAKSPMRPPEACLANGGMLYLDEVPEFERAALRGLVEIMETGHVTILRAHGEWKMPAKFVLVGTKAPCPCGYYGHPERACSCAGSAITRYSDRVPSRLFEVTIQVPGPAAKAVS